MCQWCGMTAYDKAAFPFINDLWRCWLLQVQRVAMEGFPLGRERKPHEKSHKQVGIIFICCVPLLAMMLFLSMDLCTFLAEVTEVSVWANSMETKQSQKASWRHCASF